MPDSMNCEACGGEIRIVSLHGVPGTNRLHQCEKCLACWPQPIEGYICNLCESKLEKNGNAMQCTSCGQYWPLPEGVDGEIP